MLDVHSSIQHTCQGWLGRALQVRVGDQTNITNVLWQTVSPEWDEAVFFREICAASELVVEVWDVGGSKKSEQLQRLAEEPGRLVSNSRFLGRVEVPLSETLSLKRGAWGDGEMDRGSAAGLTLSYLRCMLQLCIRAGPKGRLNRRSKDLIMTHIRDKDCLHGILESESMLSSLPESVSILHCIRYLHRLFLLMSGA